MPPPPVCTGTCPGPVGTLTCSWVSLPPKAHLCTWPPPWTCARKETCLSALCRRDSCCGSSEESRLKGPLGAFALVPQDLTPHSFLSLGKFYRFCNYKSNPGSASWPACFQLPSGSNIPGPSLGSAPGSWMDRDPDTPGPWTRGPAPSACPSSGPVPPWLPASSSSLRGWPG